MKKRLLALCLSSTMLIPSVGANLSVLADSSSNAVTVTNTAEQSSVLKADQIEKIVREKLSIDKGYKIQNTDLSVLDDKVKKYWNLNFASEDEKSTIMVKAFADNGEIFSCEYYTPTTYGTVMKVLPDDAKVAAVDFIKKLQPDKFKETEEVSVKVNNKIYSYISSVRTIYNSNEYNYSFVRKVNGEYYPNNFINVTVSPYTGKVTRFDMKWEDASYTKVSPMTQEKALKIFKVQDNLSLKYVNVYNNNVDKTSLNNDNVIIPVYSYIGKESGKINAVNGKLYKTDEIYDWNYNPLYYEFAGAMNAKAAKSDAISVGAVSEAEMIPEAGVMSREKAQKILLDKLKNNVSVGDMKLTSSRYYQNIYTKEKFWYLNLSDQKAGISLAGTVNVANEKVASLNYNYNLIPKDMNLNFDEPNKTKIAAGVASIKSGGSAADSKTSPKFDEKETGKKLTKIIASVFPELKSDEYSLKINGTPDLKNNQYVNYSSPEYIHNIPYAGNQVQITYDLGKNIVTNINFDWQTVKAKYPSKILTKDQAFKIYSDKLGLNKYLVQLNDTEKLEKDKVQSPQKECTMVYSFNNQNFAYIDAGSGKPLNYNGDEYKEDNNTNQDISDIDTDSYKNQITLMNKMGLIQLDSNKFNPKAELLKKDAVKWIVLMGNTAIRYNPSYYDNNQIKPQFKDVDSKDPYYTYIQQALNSGIIENGDTFSGDSKLTKTDITKMIINALGLKDMAKYSAMFKPVYSDSSKLQNDFLGYAALAKFNNIFGDKASDQAAFDGDKTFNRDEFIGLIYNYLASSSQK